MCTFNKALVWLNILQDFVESFKLVIVIASNFQRSFVWCKLFIFET